MTGVQHVLVQDSNSGWHVIPKNKLSQFEDWDEYNDSSEFPSWIKPVKGHPSLVVFTEFKIKNK